MSVNTHSQKLFDEALRHHQAGRLVEAEQIYQKILAADPHHADSLNLSGLIAQQKGDLVEAARLIRQAIKIRGNVPLYHSNLGNILKAQARLDEAVICYQKAITLNPNYADAHYNLGTVLQDQDKIAEALAHYGRALAMNPDLAVAHNNLGNLLRMQGRLEEAQAHLHRAIALAPDLADAYCNLGTVFKDRNKFDEAIAHYKKALALNPASADAHNNLGAMFNSRGAFADALTEFSAAIAHHPAHAEAHVNKAMMLLMAGNFTAGWREYEWRLRLKQVLQHRPAAPMWDGGDLRGKTILLLCEQGFGDSIQFVRYAPLVKARGAQVLLSCPQPLARLFGLMEGIEIFPDGVGLPAYDYYCPLMSLPHLFDTRLETVPNATPYLSAALDEVAAWGALMQPYAGLKVGLVWAGNSRLQNPDARGVDQRRSLRLEQLAPLAAISGVQFFSLQKGDPAKQIANISQLAPADFMPRVKDFADTAALITNLDLVIGVDTAVIHLAAALGKPVWVLSRFDGCWRWLLGREDSPWYPSLRLFRQTAPGDWQPAIEKVRTALASLARNAAFA